LEPRLISSVNFLRDIGKETARAQVINAWSSRRVETIKPSPHKSNQKHNLNNNTVM
jgi:hypothetical protein